MLLADREPVKEEDPVELVRRLGREVTQKARQVLERLRTDPDPWESELAMDKPPWNEPGRDPSDDGSSK